LNLEFSNKKITGMLVVVPEHERSFVDEMSNFNFPVARSMKLKTVMGYDKHRLVEGEVCVSDLVVFGMNHLFESKLLAKDDFEGLILVTQSPDYFMPPTSNVIQGQLGLKSDLWCMDINQGCAGFVVGLMQAFMMLDQPSIRRVVLVNADVMSRKVSTKDRNSYPLIGDAASITIVEKSEEGTPIHANLFMDGTRREALMIPAGGFRTPCSMETAVLETDQEGNQRALDHLRMDGSAVFNFVQVEVPPIIESLLKQSDTRAEDVDAFIFHQPNRFMLEKLADKMKVPHEKVPSNIVEHFGNSSGVTVPLAAVFNYRDRLLSGSLNACISGFGVGLTWGSILMNLGPLRFCELIDFK
jgi:3-oxoacyl-[acyl-carrier-protein] synthase III